MVRRDDFDASRTTAAASEPQHDFAEVFAALHGGEGENFEGLPSALVADRCRMVIDRRFLIEETLGEVKAEVVDILETLKRDRPGFDYGLRDLFAVEPTLADPEGPVASATARAV